MISAIVPFHDRLGLCKVSLMSLIMQKETLPVPLEIVVVDDYSEKEDDIRRFCDNLRIRYHRLGKHQGVQIARNLGFSLISDNSEMVVFSDADVIWFDGSLNSLFRQLLKEEDKAYAYGDYHRHGEFSGEWAAGSFNASRLRENPFISTMSLVRKNALPSPPFVEDEERFQDWSLWLRMLNAGHIGVYVDKVLFTTPFYTKSISSRGSQDYERWKMRILSRYVHK